MLNTNEYGINNGSFLQLINIATQPMRVKSMILATEIVTDHLKKRTASIREELQDNEGKIDPVGLYASLLAQQEIALVKGLTLNQLPTVPIR